MTAIRVDLNADAGEGAAAERDLPLLEVVTSVNLACGVHGGSAGVLYRLSAAALPRGVGVGAHPGLPGGRQVRPVSPAEAAEAVRSQIDFFRKSSLAPLQHVKLHGHLYHAARDPAVARAVAEAVFEAGAPILVAQAGSPLEQIGREVGLRVAAEAFLDRAYGVDGLLVPRGQRGALILSEEEVARRAVEIVLSRRLPAPGGGCLPLVADTLCIHGDTPGAVSLAAAARRALEEAGVNLRPLGAG